jgi:tetratricopeptide (TPR) repeat protein
MKFYKNIKLIILIVFCCKTAIAQSYSSSEKEGINFYNQGLELANQKLFDDSLISLSLSIEKFPNLMKAYFLKSRILGHLEQHEEAIKICNIALKKKDKQPIILSQKASSLYALKKYKESLEISNLAVTHGKNLAYPYIARANANTSLGHYTQAINDYDTALELVQNPSNSNLDETYLNRFCPLFKLKRYDEALATCNKALEITDNPKKLPQIYSKKALVLNVLGKYEEALENANKALKINAKDSLAISERKTAEAKLSQY